MRKYIYNNYIYLYLWPEMHQDLSELDIPNLQIYPSTTNFWEHKRYRKYALHFQDVSRNASRI